MTPDAADTLFHNGLVWSGHEGAPRPASLAVVRGRVAAVGDDRDVHNLRAPHTRVVDLGGRTLIPGFTDAHAHVWKIGHLLTTLLDVRGTDSLAALGTRLQEQHRRLPADAWLQARGYNEARFAEGRGPTRVDLDAAVRDRPVVLTRTCGHIVACNSLALARAGIGRDTPPPPGGEIDRGGDGEPSGVLRETAMGLVQRHVPGPTRDEYAVMISAALGHQLSLGITSTTDAGVAPSLLDAYRALNDEERLTARVNVMALRVMDGGGTFPLPAERLQADRLRLDTVKFFADGGLSGATAALSLPYRHADIRGVLRFEDGELLARFREADAAGWRLAVHAIGDAAIEQVLRAFEAVGRRRPGHRIEHFGLPDAGHLARAARLGVIAVPQTVFIHALGGNFRRYLPDTLLARAYPVRAMLDAGLTVALSSDAPVVENDSPLAGVQAAILRRDAEGHAIAADQAITLGEALIGYTRGGAAATGEEGTRGSLAAGMQADLAVLSGNPWETPPETLDTLRVIQTWVGGRLAYEA